ncbi:MAG: HlyD family efflux transporter periplasmic adaptor subunit [Acidobacteriota bacterium]
MATPFSRTLRSLASERSSGSLLAMVLLSLLLGLWLLWLVSAEVPVFATSSAARLEVDQAVYEVAADAGGRLVEVVARVGQVVTSGEVLFALDATLEQRRLEEEQARAKAAEREIASLRVALATETRGLADARRAEGAIEEARANTRAEQAAADLADEEAERSARLHGQGLTSEMELRRAQATASERRAQAEALAQSVARLQAERQLEERDRQARVDGIEREIAELEGIVLTSQAAVRRLEEEVRRRQIRAPVDGRLGEVDPVRPGSVVGAGERLATVIPDSVLQVVADFPPSEALARVHDGQPAQLRLDGFPWTEYGSLTATVERVATEARDGKVRVDCAVRPSPESAIPLQHGMPGTLVVEIERVSPAQLVLRAAGRAITPQSSAEPL